MCLCKSFQFTAHLVMKSTQGDATDWWQTQKLEMQLRLSANLIVQTLSPSMMLLKMITSKRSSGKKPSVTNESKWSMTYTFWPVSEFVSCSGNNGWIGLTDAENEGTFVWLDGTICKLAKNWLRLMPLDFEAETQHMQHCWCQNKTCGLTWWGHFIPAPYLKFKDGEPNGDSNENCVMMYSDGNWTDESCAQSSQKWQFACEKEEVLPCKIHVAEQILTCYFVLFG